MRRRPWYSFVTATSRSATSKRGVVRNERSSVAIRSKAQVNEVKNRRCPGDSIESASVTPGRGLQIGFLHRHREDLLGPNRGVREQAFAEVGEVAVRVALRCDPLIHLSDEDPRPRNLLAGQVAEHLPGSCSPADREHEPAACRNGLPALGC